MNNTIKVGVGVIVLKDEKILLGHRVSKYKDTGGIYEPDSWTLPGGKQEYNETILDCAKRETLEETNLNIDDLEIFGADDDIAVDRHFITLYVLSKSHTGNLKVMEIDKIDEWKWFDINNLPNNLYSPSEKEIKTYVKKRGF